MKSVALYAVFAFILGLAMQVSAQGKSPEKTSQLTQKTETIEKNILSGLRAARPDLDFGTPEPSPIDGYYEVSISDAQTIYVSEDGKHFFSGELYFAEPGRFINSTEMARTKKRLDTLAKLDESEMIVFAPEGETKASMTVFTDVTCGFCRKLHNQMAEMNALGIEVRYMAYPRSGIKREGSYTREYTQTAKAWCADDRRTAMSTLKNGGDVPGEVCDAPVVSKHYQIGSQFGVTGTPAIILPDGSLLPGYRSPQDYAQILGIKGDS